MAPGIELADVSGLLGLAPDTNLRALYRASLAPQAKLAEPLLSAARRGGLRLGALGEARLDMAVRRLDFYRQLIADLREKHPGLTTLKGPDIARHYPADVIRGCVDLDLHAAHAATVWEAARSVRAVCDVEETSVSVVRSAEGYDVFVGMTWPSPYSDLDPVYRVELSTLPFLGNGSSVAPRQGLPTTGVALQLLFLAEEQFQRPIAARDLLDARILVPNLAEEGSAELLEQGERFHLAPELHALFTAARATGGTGGTGQALLGEWIGRLEAAAQTELSRRRRTTGQLSPPARVAYGLVLDPELRTAEPYFVDDAVGTLLLCPLGAYLLTEELELPEERYERALLALAGLRGAHPGLRTGA